MAQLKALHNHIIFQFEQGMTRHMGVKQFQEKEDWGLEYVAVDDSTSKPRWVRVIAVGHKCDPVIKPGMRILVENLKWTKEVEFEGELYARTDDSVVLGWDPTVTVD
jgi:hypothetical protein